MKDFKKALQLFVFQCFLFAHSGAHAGSFEDFFLAIELDHPPTLAQLKTLGFDLNTRNERGEPPLYLALASESYDVAAWLAEQPEVDVEARGNEEETPLMMAVIRGQFEIARALIARGAQVNKPGWTPLHYAASHGGDEAPALVRLLIRHHAYLDAASPNGTTPLMMAAYYGHESNVKILLEAGADPQLRNQQGRTAIDFAQRAGRMQAADVIAAFVRARQPAGW